MRKLFLLLLVLVPSFAFAATAQDLLPPDTIVNILTAIEGFPYVGPVLVVILKWIAIIAPIMTALSVCVQAVLAVPEIAARYAGAHDLADKIGVIADKINYYLKYFSIRNAEKPQ